MLPFLILNSQDWTVNSPLWLLHISFVNKLQEFGFRSRLQLLPDKYEYSDHLFTG